MCRWCSWSCNHSVFLKGQTLFKNAKIQAFLSYFSICLYHWKKKQNKTNNKPQKNSSGEEETAGTFFGFWIRHTLNCVLYVPVNTLLISGLSTGCLMLLCCYLLSHFISWPYFASAFFLSSVCLSNVIVLFSLTMPYQATWVRLSFWFDFLFWIYRRSFPV